MLERLHRWKPTVNYVWFLFPSPVGHFKLNARFSKQIFINIIHQIRRYRSGALQFRVHYRI